MAKKFLTGIDASAQRVQNVGDPSGPSDAATKAYVDNVASGLRWKQPVAAASTGNLTLSATQTVDGVALVAGDRVLVKNQTTASENGIYDVAATSWVRSGDANSAAELTGATVNVLKGTANGDKAFTQTTDDIVLGTSSIVWAQVGGGTTYSADSQGIELSGTTFSLELDGNTLQKSASGLRIGSGAAGLGLNESGGVLGVNAGAGLEVVADSVRIAAAAVGSGLQGGAGQPISLNPAVAGAGLAYSAGVLSVGQGDGISVAADTVAVDNTVVRTPATVTRKYAVAIGNGSATSFLVAHGLGTVDVVVQVYENAGGKEQVFTDVAITDADNVTVTFATAPTATQYRVVVHG